jgi:catechol 2,3-dioxygenase-like lactoylglutathione lyase family enzyme
MGTKNQSGGGKMKFNSLIPELSVSNFATSLNFYKNILGFQVDYERRESRFAFLSLEGAQLMIEEINSHWITGALEAPFGRGINFQIEVKDIGSIVSSLNKNNYPLFRQPSEESYRVADGTRLQRQFLTQDPDGYLLRFCQELQA